MSKTVFSLLALVILLASCTFMHQDFDKYEKNYKKLDLHLLTLGDSKDRVVEVLGQPVNVIGSKKFMDGIVEVWAYEKWHADLGSDSIEEVYWLYFLNGKLEQWGRPGDWSKEADRIYEKGKGDVEEPQTPSDRHVRSIGTGFFISPDGLVLTARHVVAKAEDIKVQTASGVLAAKVLLQDAATDLALLKVEKSGKPTVLPIVPSTDMKVGEPVFTIGFPNVDMQGTEPKYTEGSISSLTGPGNNPRYFQISIPVQPGNSGGPLLNERGQVIGMVNARLDDLLTLTTSGMLPQNVNYAVKSSFIIPFLEGIEGLSTSSNAKDETAVERSAVIERAKQAVVMVVCY